MIRPLSRRLWLDFDDKTLEFVVREARRLQRKFGLESAEIIQTKPSQAYDSQLFGVGVVEIARYHLKFRDGLRWEEVERAMLDSKAHDGFVWFSRMLQDITLRTSPIRSWPKRPAPWRVCTVNPNGEVIK